MSNLTREQIDSIPERLKDPEMTAKKLAEEWGTHEQTIYSWIRKLRKSGVEVETKIGRRPILG